MGSRIVMVNGIPVLAEDDPALRGASETVVPHEDPSPIVDPWAAVGGAEAPVRTMEAPPGTTPEGLVSGAQTSSELSPEQIDRARRGEVALVSPAVPPPPPADMGTGASDVSSPSSASPPPAPEPAVSSSPGDAVDAAGNVLGTAGDTAVDFAKSALTPYGIAGPPPAPPPETPDEYEARLNGTWERLAATLPMVPAEQRLDHIQEMGRVAEELKGIYAQRGVGAAQDVAAEQMRLQQEAQAKAAEVEKAAAERKAAIEADVKKQRDHALKLDEDAANAKIDRSWNPGGTANGIMLAISVAMAGLGSALKHQGDRNPALDILLKQVDARVEDQWKKKRETHDWAKGQIDRLDVYRNDTLLSEDQAKERAKIALLRDYADQIKNVASTMPSAKRAALDATVAAAMDRVTAMEGAWDAEAHKRAVKNLEDVEKKRHAIESEKIDRSRVGVEWGRLRLSREQFDKANEQWDKDYELRKAKNDADIAKAEREGNAGALANAKAQRDLLAAEIGGLIPEAKKNADGSPMTKGGVPIIGYQPIMEPDPEHPGQMKVWIPNGKDAEIAKFREHRSKSLSVLQATDRLVQMIKDNGWEPDFLRSDAFQREWSLYNGIILNTKDVYDLGSLQGGGAKGGEYALVAGYTGTKDPTSLARLGDPTSGLREFRAGIERALYNEMTGLGYGGSPVHVPEANDYGEQERIDNTPAGDMARVAKGRVTVRDTATASEWASPEQLEYAQGNPGKLPYKGIPNAAAYDTIQRAGDIAAGLTDQDPQVGKDLLRNIIQTESHDPAWMLAANVAFQNNIDLADGLGGLNDFFTPQAYRVAAKTGSPEVMRMLYGQDPTYGYGGTEEARAEHKKRAGIQVTGAEVAPFARRFIPGAPGAADAERILRLTPRR